MEIKRGEDSRTAAKAGRLDEIPADIYVRYYRTLKEIAKDHMPELPALTVLKNLGIYGDAGNGKTALADLILPRAFPKNCDKGWDGYQYQDGVIINDLDKYHVALAYDLKIGTEHRSFIAHTKGGAIRIRPSCIIVTSQYRHDQIGTDQETVDAITRRFHFHHLATPIPFAKLPELAEEIKFKYNIL